MGPDIDLIYKSANLENLKLVGGRWVEKWSKIKCLGLVWEWFGGVGEAIGNKNSI